MLSLSLILHLSLSPSLSLSLSNPPSLPPSLSFPISISPPISLSFSLSLHPSFSLSLHLSGSIPLPLSHCFSFYRVISRAPGLKLVVETLITSLKPIGNIVLICCAFFIIFGILGVQLFKGKFFYCFGPDVKNITNKSDCLQANYKWVHHKY
uniref:Ion transport domain-containing protein n=1 Tax=Hucho hucho TaxID=62062 RepID=A0A4W5MRI0_9TELE